MSSESPKGRLPAPERAAVTVEQRSLHISPLPSPADLAHALGLATLAACIAAALSGHDGVGIALAASSFIGVVAAFLRNRLAVARSAARGDPP